MTFQSKHKKQNLQLDHSTNKFTFDITVMDLDCWVNMQWIHFGVTDQFASSCKHCDCCTELLERLWCRAWNVSQLNASNVDFNGCCERATEVALCSNKNQQNIFKSCCTFCHKFVLFDISVHMFVCC